MNIPNGKKLICQLTVHETGPWWSKASCTLCKRLFEPGTRYAELARSDGDKNNKYLHVFCLSPYLDHIFTYWKEPVFLEVETGVEI